MIQYLTKKQECELLRSQLENEASTFTSHWRDLSDYIKPRSSKFFISDTNKGDKRNQHIIDSTATMSLRTLQSGMMAGVTSPARPWFKLGFTDVALTQIPSVKEWLASVEESMRTVFARSNLYKVLPITFGALGTYATGAMVIEEDYEKVVRFKSSPIGSFKIATDEEGRVRVFYREFQMTVRQVVEQFLRQESGEIDWTNASELVKNQWDMKQFERWIDVVHIIKPNSEYLPNKLESKYKKFWEVYYERGTLGKSDNAESSNYDRFLWEKGYDYFPVLCPRWETNGEDVYGTDCPGMVALGDIKQLQLMEKRGAQAIEKMVNPAMIAPTTMKNQKASILPGDITYVDDKDIGLARFRPAHDVNYGMIQPLEAKEEQIRMRIKRAFYEDLFLMLAESDRRDITATEILERKEEKLLALGPVLEQLNQDLLDPLIDITFAIMYKQGLIPEPPEEIQGMEIKVEYISIMAQAQKLAGIGNIERFIGFVGQLASLKPAALDNLDEDEAVAVYGDLVGAPLKLIKSKDKVMAMRQAQAEQQAAAQQMEVAGAQVEAAKNLSQTSMDGNSALNQLIG